MNMGNTQINKQTNESAQTHTHTHICVCVCVCIYKFKFHPRTSNKGPERE